MMQSKTVPIKGMHCKSCTVIVADELSKLSGVKHASVSIKTDMATIRFTEEPSESEIEQAVRKAGYDVGFEKKTFFSKDKSTYITFIFSIAWAVIVLLLFQRLGFTGISLEGLTNNKGLMALAVGVTAGFSTCMALVGGLVLGLSSRYAEKHQSATVAQRFRPHLLFNLGRITTFFILGGVMGLFGSVFRLDSSLTGVLTIIIGLVMIVLGLQLTELFPRLTNNGFTLPAGIAKFFGINQHKQKEYSHRNAMILGGLTFFLPCGFTQAMQLVAISSGSFATGSIVMGLFAIGTAPGLLGIGGLTSIIKGKFAKVFFRFAGVLVVLLAVYNIGNGFNLMGYNFTPPDSQQKPLENIKVNKSATVLSTTFSPSRTSPVDIEPSTFDVKTGESYVLEIDVKQDGEGCMSTIMIPGVYNTPVLLVKGKVRLPFKIDKPGTYKITCAMGITRGTINATERGTK